MKFNVIAVPALALALMASTGAAFAQGGYPQGPPPPQGGYQQGPGGYQQGPGGYQQGPGGYELAPPEFREAQRRGYRDGVEGARKDFENHRAPNVRNRDEFRNPSFIAPPDRRDYKFGFRKGYDNAVRHMYGQGGR